MAPTRYTLDLHGFFRAICPSPLFSSAALRRKKTAPQRGLCSGKSWPRRHEADGGQEELDGRWVSLPSGSSRRRRNLQLRSMRSTIRPKPFLFFRRLAAEEKQIRNTALVAASLGPAGMKPTEAKKSSIERF